ncbi:MAG: hypothetical protein ACJ8C4_15175 [Gemmataceae bacterium]
MVDQCLGNFGSVTTDSTTESRTHDIQNRLTGVGSDSLAYDDMGNMTEDDQGQSDTYDAWNRMIGVGSQTERNAHDALVRRIKEGDRNHWPIYSRTGRPWKKSSITQSSISTSGAQCTSMRLWPAWTMLNIRGRDRFLPPAVTTFLALLRALHAAPMSAFRHHSGRDVSARA